MPKADDHDSVLFREDGLVHLPAIVQVRQHVRHPDRRVTGLRDDTNHPGADSPACLRTAPPAPCGGIPPTPSRLRPAFRGRGLPWRGAAATPPGPSGALAATRRQRRDTLPPALPCSALPCPAAAAPRERPSLGETRQRNNGVSGSGSEVVTFARADTPLGCALPPWGGGGVFPQWAGQGAPKGRGSPLDHTKCASRRGRAEEQLGPYQAGQRGSGSRGRGVSHCSPSQE